MGALNVVLITGISGSGKSVALRMLEDADYTCVDNLPVRFLHEFITSRRDNAGERIAVAIDARSADELGELPEIITSLRAGSTQLRVVFLEANDETLLQRYAESRRRHPLSDRMRKKGKVLSLEDCIAQERELLDPLRDQGRGAEQGSWLWQPGDGICLEPMEYPDAPNQPGFPVRWLAPGDVVQGAIVYRFTG